MALRAGLSHSSGQAFESHLVNGQVAENLSKQDLLSIGISDDLLRRRALRELERLFEPFRDPGLKLNPIGKVAAGTRPLSLGQRRGLPRPHSARARSSSRHSNTSVRAMATSCDLSGGSRTPGHAVTSQEMICASAAQQAGQPLLTRSTHRKPLRPASGIAVSVGQRNATSAEEATLRPPSGINDVSAREPDIEERRFKEDERG